MTTPDCYRNTHSLWLIITNLSAIENKDASYHEYDTLGQLILCDFL
jgi:hypothetical protein